MNKTTMAGMMIGAGLLGAILATAFRPTVTPDIERLEALEHRLERLERQVAASGERARPVADDATATATHVIGREVTARLQQVETALARVNRNLPPALARRVEQEIEEKVAELERESNRKQNKKPSLDVFAEVLELTDDQRRLVDEQVWTGQEDVRAILEIPTADGSNLVDELVEAVAYGEALHPDAGPLFARWLGRVISEKIPGTEVSYGAEIEAAKNEVRAAFRQAFTEDQYAEFEGWGVDPVEIEEIENSPWADFDQRVRQRVLELTQ